MPSLALNVWPRTARRLASTAINRRNWSVPVVFWRILLMKRNLVRLMLVLAVAVVAQFAVESQAEAGLFGRNGGGGGRLFGGRHNNGCYQQSCQPVCCEPAPVVDCGCATDCCNGGGRRHRGRRHQNGCCDTGCQSGCNGSIQSSGTLMLEGTPTDAGAPTAAPTAPSGPGGGGAPPAPGAGGTL
jgi:hypothetical protein